MSVDERTRARRRRKSTGGIVPLPFDSREWSNDGIAGLGHRVAVYARSQDTYQLWALDRPTLSWIDVPLELGALSNQDHPEFVHVDGSILIGNDQWVPGDDGVYAPGPQQLGVIVRPDLTVERISAPPDGVEMSWTSVVGHFALLMGRETGQGDVAFLHHPWMYDTEADAWTEIPDPYWLDCTEPCAWNRAHEFGDTFLEAGTPTGVVKMVPDGSVGVFDPSTTTWRPIDDVPVAPNSPSIVIPNYVIVAPIRDVATGDFGDIALLDLATGAWSVETVDVEDPSVFSWDVRSDRYGAVLIGAETREPAHPALVLDQVDGRWRAATEYDEPTWLALASSTTIDDLGALWDSFTRSSTTTVTATEFVHDGSAPDVCTAAGIEASTTGYEFDGIVLSDQRSVIDGVETRWLVCTGDPASGWGVTVLVSDDSVNWRLGDLGLGNFVHAGDVADAQVVGGIGMIHYESPLAERSADATTVDGGATWTVVVTEPE